MIDKPSAQDNYEIMRKAVTRVMPGLGSNVVMHDATNDVVHAVIDIVEDAHKELKRIADALEGIEMNTRYRGD